MRVFSSARSSAGSSACFQPNRFQPVARARAKKGGQKKIPSPRTGHGILNE
jgi:hypothetical protein